jgi:hypothetical protein
MVVGGHCAVHVATPDFGLLTPTPALHRFFSHVHTTIWCYLERCMVAGGAVDAMHEDVGAAAAEVPLGPFLGLDALAMHHFDLPDPDDPRTALRLEDLTAKPPPPPLEAVPPWPGVTSSGTSPTTPLSPPHKPRNEESFPTSMTPSPMGGAAVREPESASRGHPIMPGVLRIMQQPASHGRFRYSKEVRLTLHACSRSPTPAT